MPIKAMEHMQADFTASLRRVVRRALMYGDNEPHPVRRKAMAIGERCPACGHMAGDGVPGPTLSYEGQLTAWAVELTRASTTPGETPAEVGSRLRTLHQALQGLHDGPASDPPAS